MKTYTATPPQITAAAVLRTLWQFLTLATLYAWQTFRNACRMAQSLCQWLRSSHNLSNEEGEIILTGWQCLGFAFAAFAFALLLSIDWGAMI